MEHHIIHKFIIIICTFLLTACTTPYQAFNNNPKKPLGYKELLLTAQDSSSVNNKRYLLSYYGDGTKEQNHLDWQARANELCPTGYQIIKHEKEIFHSSFKSPVNGMMVRLYTQQPVDRGIIECQ